MRILISIVSVILAIIIRSYVIHIYGIVCGVNLLNWNTWSNVLHTDSATCTALEWTIKHSNQFLVSVVTALGMYILSELKSFTKMRN
jgi:hypothetical protein